MFGNEGPKSILGCSDSLNKENKILFLSDILYTLTRNSFKTYDRRLTLGFILSYFLICWGRFQGRTIVKSSHFPVFFFLLGARERPFSSPQGALCRVLAVPRVHRSNRCVSSLYQLPERNEHLSFLIHLCG